MIDFVVVIPARYGSERLPGKPLREIRGKPLLQYVFDQARTSSADEVVVATDDERIARIAREFGADVCLTDNRHRSGTERLAEVCRLRGWPQNRIVVNLQGDEPLMPPALIDQCAGLLEPDGVEMATLASPFASRKDFDNPNVVKVVVDNANNALYFSRAAIPRPRERRSEELAWRSALHHHGIYAYRAEIIQQIVSAPPSPLEECEQLEQLRALQMGIRIRVGVPAVRPGPGVDTEADLARVEQLV